MVDLDLIQYDERVVGANSPDYDDTLNRALLQVVSASGADDSAFVGFALRPTVAPTVGQFYRATDTGVGASWQTLTTAMISDLASAATAITKVGTIDTGVWNGTSISTTYTDAKVKSTTGTANRITIGGTAADPTFDIAASYVGQVTITTLGTIATGVWTANSIGTAYTDAKVVSITGTSNRLSVAGTATVPVLDIALTYIGQGSITTVGTIVSGTWQGTAIADTYLAALSVSKLTGTTIPVTVVTSSLTAVGTIGTGVWQGTSIATTYTDAKIVSVTGTSNRVTIGGSATAPTVDIAATYVGQTSVTTLGTITTGTWAATTVSVDKGGTGLTSYAIGDVVYASGATTLSKLSVGTAAQFLQVNGGATAPAWHTLVTADITDLTSATTGITKVGTVTTGIWNAGIVSGIYGGTGVNNGSSTITLAGNLVTVGAFALTLTATGATNVTLPTTGTLVNTAVTSLGSLTSVGGAFAISGAFTGATTGAFSSTVTASSLIVSAAVGTLVPGATSFSLRNNANNADNFIVLDAGSATLRAGLAIGGALSGVTTLAASGVITQGNTTGGVYVNQGATTNAKYLQFGNSGTTGYFGIESSTSGSVITGATAYDVVIRGTSGISFSANDGAAVSMRIASTHAVAFTAGITATTVTATSGLTVSAGTSAVQALTATSAVVTSAGTGMTSNTTAAQANFNAVFKAQRSGTDHWWLALDASDQFSVLNAAGSANNLVITDAGAATFRSTVTATGATLTGLGGGGGAVSVGASDSGGSGFRLLRVPN